VAEFESGKLAAVRAMRMDADAFAAELSALDALVATGSFDPMLNALDAYAELFNRFYDDADRRAEVEAKIEACVSKMPVNVHIELLQKLARYALERRDQGKALTLVNAAQHAMARATWIPEQRIRLAARLAEVRHHAGDTEQARKDVDAARAMFEAERDAIVNIYRAGALREVAEAYQAIGDASAALAIYKRAIEAGVENPNSRPRAEDLSATCCSMAKAGFEPDESLRARIAEVQAALGDPW
jgi:tetratricopeptide (TPR) repeat protein